MSHDPIIAETRALREALMNDVGNDLDTLFEYLSTLLRKFDDVSSRFG